MRQTAGLAHGDQQVTQPSHGQGVQQQAMQQGDQQQAAQQSPTDEANQQLQTLQPSLGQGVQQQATQQGNQQQAEQPTPPAAQGASAGDMDQLMQALGWKTSSQQQPQHGQQLQHRPSLKNQQHGPYKAALFQPQTKLPAAATPPAKQPAYTRKAAANLIQRLKESPARLAGLPSSLKDMVNDESKKSELITVLCESSGDLAEAGAMLEAYEESCRIEANRKLAVRWTKKQMHDKYGDDAEKVMAHKHQEGMVEKDENCQES